MLLTLAVYDTAHNLRGSARIRLDWGQNTWFLEEDQQQAWQHVGFSREGSFEVKSWGVIWLWDQQHNTVIFWDAPTSESDSTHLSGAARILDPKDPAFKEGKISWTIDTAGIPALSALRENALQKLKEILPAPYGSKKWQANPYHSSKPGPTPGYTNCVEFPAYLVWLLGGKKLLPGFPSKTTTGWKDADGVRQPLPGDIYVLCKTAKRDETLSHVGVIVSASGAEWETADWGQHDGWGGDFVKRAYDAATDTLTGEVDPTKGNARPPRAIKGWVDLDEYFDKS